MTKRVYKGPSKYNDVLSYAGWAMVRGSDEEVAVDTEDGMHILFRHNVWYLYEFIPVFVPESFYGWKDEVNLRYGRNIVRLSVDQFKELFITKGICDY